MIASILSARMVNRARATFGYTPLLTAITWSWEAENLWWNTWILNKRIKLTLITTVCGRSTSYPRTNAAARPTWYMPRESSARKAARQFSTSFLLGSAPSMDDTRVNEEMPFVLDRVPKMEENSEEYRVEPARNEVEAKRGNVTLLQKWRHIFPDDTTW